MCRLLLCLLFVVPQDGIVSPTDTALRDFCARCVREYTKWAIKQTSKKVKFDTLSISSLVDSCLQCPSFLHKWRRYNLYNMVELSSRVAIFLSIDEFQFCRIPLLRCLPCLCCIFFLQQLESSPTNIKSLLKRLYVLARHPSAYNRLGAALAFNAMYTVFRFVDVKFESTLQHTSTQCPHSSHLNIV